MIEAKEAQLWEKENLRYWFIEDYLLMMIEESKNLWMKLMQTNKD